MPYSVVFSFCTSLIALGTQAEAARRNGAGGVPPPIIPITGEVRDRRSVVALRENALGCNEWSKNPE